MPVVCYIHLQSSTFSLYIYIYTVYIPIIWNKQHDLNHQKGSIFSFIQYANIPSWLFHVSTLLQLRETIGNKFLINTLLKMLLDTSREAIHLWTTTYQNFVLVAHFSTDWPQKELRLVWNDAREPNFRSYRTPHRKETDGSRRNLILSNHVTISGRRLRKRTFDWLFKSSQEGVFVRHFRALLFCDVR
jgi:hypothetical protein